MTKQSDIKIVIIKGSVRPGNYTGKVVTLIADELLKNDRITAEIVDPNEYQLPLPGMDSQNESALRLQQLVRQANGVILATPEYHGGYSSVIKLMIENMGFPSAIKAKPVYLVGVASGRIGAIKSIEGLRTVCSHVGALVLPGSVSVAGVQKIFDQSGKCTDAQAEKQIRSAAINLLDYLQNHACPRHALEEMVRTS